jgi:DNA-binding Xre family transcriptional regulator
MKTSTKPKKWDSPGFQRTSNVKTDRGYVLVYFEDGTTANVESRKILSSEINQPRWERLRFNPYEIILPTERGEIEISWSTMRVLSDAEYSAHLSKVVEEQAKKIGRRLKELRQRRGLKSKELAERAGITPQSLSRIENGRHDVALSTLQKLLGAMGYGLKDLTIESDATNNGLRHIVHELVVS